MEKSLNEGRLSTKGWIRCMWLFYFSRAKNCERNFTMHCRRTSGLFQRFYFSMIKRRENESGKAFFGFCYLVLTVSLFTDKNLTQAIGSNLSIFISRVLLSEPAEAEP